MSYTYQNFASLPVNLNRQAYGALDISQVFTSLNDLKYYVTKGAHTTGVSEYWYESEDKKVVPYPYAGQYLALVDNDTRKVTAYILEEKADGTFDYKEVGITPIGDDKTVDVDAAGKITLHGIDGKDSGTYVPKLVDGELVWAEPSALTVEDLDTRIQDLETAKGALEAADVALGGRIDGVAETVGQHTTQLGELAAADTQLSGRIDGHDTRLENLEATVNGKAAVGNPEEDDYQPAVVGLTTTVEDHEQRIGSVEAGLTNVYTKTQTNEKIAEEIGKMAHFSAKVVTSTAEMTDATVLYLYKPEGATGSDVYEQYIVIEGVPTLIGETSVDLSDYAKSADVTEEIGLARTEIEAAYGEADRQLGLRIDGISQTVNKLGETYATIEDMNKKADQEDLDDTNERVDDHETRLGSLEAATHTHGNKDVLDEITADKVAQWDKAEENVVKSVKDGELAVSEAGELSVVAIDQSKVTGLADKFAGIEGDLAGKVDARTGYGLISDADLAKLTNLSASGTLDASKVDNLGTWITENREAIGGLMSAEEETKLANIAAGAQVNVLEGVTVAGAALTPDANKIVNIPFATNTTYGVVQGDQAVNAVMINSSNKMEVHSLNVNKLVQDENTVLILNGGNA